MAVIQWSTLPSEQPYPGVTRVRFDGHGFSAYLYRFAPQAVFPLHRHPEEQILYVVEGWIEMANGDERLEIHAGEGAWTAPGVPHSVRAGSAGAAFLSMVVPRRSSEPERVR